MLSEGQNDFDVPRLEHIYIDDYNVLVDSEHNSDKLLGDPHAFGIK